MSEQKKNRSPRRKWRGNTGITATHVTVWTMNHEPLPDDIHIEIDCFLRDLVERHPTRILTDITRT